MYMVVKDKKNAYDCIGSEHRKNGFSLFQEKGKLCMIAWYVLYHIPFHLLKNHSISFPTIMYMVAEDKGSTLILPRE